MDARTIIVTHLSYGRPALAPMADVDRMLGALKEAGFWIAPIRLTQAMANVGHEIIEEAYSAPTIKPVASAIWDAVRDTYLKERR